MFRGFTQKKVNSYTLGEQLKNIRGQGRITLHEVSRETKIPVKYLEMIEDGKYDSLPPDVYVKGFLKSYADFLGVEARKIIKLYQRERDIKNNMGGQEQKKPVEQKKTKVANFIVTPRLVVVATVVLAIVGGFYYLYRQVGRFAAEPRLVITDPSGDENIDGNSIMISGFTDSDAKLSINDQPVMVSDSGAFSENILLQSGMNAITISSANRFNKSVSKTLNVKSGYKIAENSQNDQDGKVSGDEDVKKNKVSVIVRVDNAATWLSVESDGNLVYSGTMLPGAVQNFEGEKEVRVTSGKANRTFIRVNGKDEKTLDNSPGIVRDVVFTPND